MKISAWPAALAAAALLAGCNDTTPSKPQPGVLTVSLNAAQQADRALLVSITGPAAGEVQPAAPGLSVFARAQGTTTHVAVLGAIAGGPLLYVSVPDTRVAPQYHATVLEAADVQNTPRSSVAVYQLTVARQGDGR